MEEVDKYLERISVTFPSIKWKKAKLITDNGLDYAVVILDDDVVFRFPREGGSPSTTLATEMKLLEKLNPIVNIEIPNYNYRGLNNSFGGYDLIQGGELDTSKLTKELKSERTSAEIAGFLKTLHDFDVAEAKRIGVRDSELYDKIAKDVHRKLKLISERLSDEEVEFIEAALAEMQSFEYERRCLIHGDLCRGHILIRNNEISGIIDFGDVEIGDPSMDLAFFWDFGKEFMDMLYDHYKGPKDKGLLRRAEINNLSLHVSNVYWGIKIKKNEWLDPSLRTLKEIVKRGFFTDALQYSTSER